MENYKYMCLVKNCVSNRYEKVGRSFFMLPKDVERQNAWLKALNICPKYLTKKCNSVCELHFLPKDFTNRLIRTRIKSTAVPSLHINQCSSELDQQEGYPSIDQNTPCIKVYVDPSETISLKYVCKRCSFSHLLFNKTLEHFDQNGDCLVNQKGSFVINHKEFDSKKIKLGEIFIKEKSEMEYKCLCKGIFDNKIEIFLHLSKHLDGFQNKYMKKQVTNVTSEKELDRNLAHINKTGLISKSKSLTTNDATVILPTRTEMDRELDVLKEIISQSSTSVKDTFNHQNIFISDETNIKTTQSQFNTELYQPPPIEIEDENIFICNETSQSQSDVENCQSFTDIKDENVFIYDTTTQSQPGAADCQSFIEIQNANSSSQSDTEDCHSLIEIKDENVLICEDTNINTMQIRSNAENRQSPIKIEDENVFITQSQSDDGSCQSFIEIEDENVFVCDETTQSEPDTGNCQTFLEIEIENTISQSDAEDCQSLADIKDENVFISDETTHSQSDVGNCQSFVEVEDENIFICDETIQSQSDAGNCQSLIKIENENTPSQTDAENCHSFIEIKDENVLSYGEANIKTTQIQPKAENCQSPIEIIDENIFICNETAQSQSDAEDGQSFIEIKDENVFIYDETTQSQPDVENYQSLNIRNKDASNEANTDPNLFILNEDMENDNFEILQNDNIIIHRCEQCSKTFTKKINLLCHVKNFHKTTRKIKNQVISGLIEKTLSSKVCGKSFNQKKLSKNFRKYICPAKGCDSKYFLRSDLDDHITKCHTINKPFVCFYCYKNFSTRSTFNRHRRTQRNDLRLYCDICKWRLCTATQLKQHKRFHTHTSTPNPLRNCSKSQQKDLAEEESNVDVINFINMRHIRDNSNPLDMPTPTFLRYFRLSKAAFKFVLDIVESKMKVTIRSSSVLPIIKLTATLRFLAEGFYVGIPQSTFSTVLKEILDVLEKYLCPQMIKFPQSENEKNEVKEYFYSKYRLPGIIGCVDGTHIKMFAPPEKVLYCNRKGFYSLNAMLVCDHKMRITFIDSKFPGSCDDSFAWNSSDLDTLLATNYNNGEMNTWLIGDAGYNLKPYLMTPYRTVNVNNEAERRGRKMFNERHSKARNIIKKTIAILKNRFRCILGHRQLHFEPHKCVQIVNVSCALHNLCIKYGVELLDLTEPEMINSDNYEMQDDAPNQDNQTASIIRDRIMNRIK